MNHVGGSSILSNNLTGIECTYDKHKISKSNTLEIGLHKDVVYYLISLSDSFQNKQLLLL